MDSKPFPHHRPAALALLTKCPDLSHKEAGFLGHMCVAVTPSEKQLAWLAKLLDRKGLPPLKVGGAHG